MPTSELEGGARSADPCSEYNNKKLLGILAGLFSDITGEQVCVCIKISEQVDAIAAESESDLMGKSVLNI